MNLQPFKPQFNHSNQFNCLEFQNNTNIKMWLNKWITLLAYVSDLSGMMYGMFKC